MDIVEYLHQAKIASVASLPAFWLGVCAFTWFMFANYCGGLVKIMGFDPLKRKVAAWAIMGEFVITIGLMLLFLPILFNNFLGI